jgi:hypothetical protein
MTEIRFYVENDTIEKRINCKANSLGDCTFAEFKERLTKNTNYNPDLYWFSQKIRGQNGNYDLILSDTNESSNLAKNTDVNTGIQYIIVYLTTKKEGNALFFLKT